MDITSDRQKEGQTDGYNETQRERGTDIWISRDRDRKRDRRMDITRQKQKDGQTDGSRKQGSNMGESSVVCVFGAVPLTAVGELEGSALFAATASLRHIPFQNAMITVMMVSQLLLLMLLPPLMVIMMMMIIR